jgi:hypothetical protein
MIPTLASVTPSVGHTGGQCLCEIRGTGFALPAAPISHGPTPAVPIPSVSVTLGGIPCPTVFVISSTLLRVLTPIHDPSGYTPVGGLPVAASDLVVQNLNALGVPIVGETATLPACYSFQRPVFNAATPSVAEIAIKALITELIRQVHPNVQFQPHTDYDAATGDGLNLCEFASLPGIALTGLRLPANKDSGDREQMEVDLGGGLVAVRRQPVITDAYLTAVVVSDSTSELLWLESVIKMFAGKNGVLNAIQNGQPVSWVLDYQRDEPVTFTDRAAGVEWFTADFMIRRIQETDMPGISGASTPGDGIGLHEATMGIAYKVGVTKVAKQSGVG